MVTAVFLLMCGLSHFLQFNVEGDKNLLMLMNLNMDYILRNTENKFLIFATNCMGEASYTLCICLLLCKTQVSWQNTHFSMCSNSSYHGASQQCSDSEEIKKTLREKIDYR